MMSRVPGVISRRFLSATGFETPSHSVTLSRSRSAKEYPERWVFSGDRLSTDHVGTVQVRVRAARLLLASSSSATLAQEEPGPSATLTAGTATFSTANSKAFTLHVASAVLRPNTDQPTVGKVTVLGSNELIVKGIRGSLEIAVEDDVREIPEGAAYRVVLDRNAPEPQGPRGAGTKGMGGPPIKGAKSKFIWYAIAISGGVTIWVAHEATESCKKPHDHC